MSDIMDERPVRVSWHGQSADLVVIDDPIEADNPMNEHCYSEGTPTPGGHCETNGHYICDTCVWRATCSGGCGRRPTQCDCPECEACSEKLHLCACASGPYAGDDGFAARMRRRRGDLAYRNPPDWFDRAGDLVLSAATKAFELGFVLGGEADMVASLGGAMAHTLAGVRVMEPALELNSEGSLLFMWGVHDARLVWRDRCLGHMEFYTPWARGDSGLVPIFTWSGLGSEDTPELRNELSRRAWDMEPTLRMAWRERSGQ